MHRLVVVFLTIVVPAFAWACPVCFEADGERRVAYYIATAAMMLIPSAMIVGGVLWVRRHVLAAEQSPQESGAAHQAD